MTNPTVSIIICTCNQASSLAQTMAAIGQINIPVGLNAEVLVVDNNSTDNTASLVQSTHLQNMLLRYVLEPRQGKGYAYNTGMAHAQGVIFLFTDDDVRPPQDWIEGMCAPILAGKADAVAGGVALAPHLLRDWMQPIHRACLASTELLNPERPEYMVGANMAFSRNVLEKVPEFDVELGPGALGFGDDLLFTLQLREAGYNIISDFNIEVEHHPALSRMNRNYWKSFALKQARTNAYIDYHWEHAYHGCSVRRLVKLYIQQKLRFLIKKINRSEEGMELNEIQARICLAYYRYYKLESKRPHKYELRGLLKLHS